MRIAEMNWIQVEAYLHHDDRCVLPFGSTEQHAQLSLCVDAILAEKVAVEAAEPLGIPVYPAMPFGLAPYFASFPGSISLKVETLLAVARDLIESVARAGFRRILIVNGHGGNAPVGALALQSDGTISPGNSPGTLSVIGTTTWAGGGNYNWQLLDATGTAGSGWDTVSITGALDLTNLTLGSPFKVNLWSLSTFAGSGGNALNFNSSLSYSWTIASASSGITGFDANEFSIYTTAVNGTNGFSNSFAGTFSMSQSGNNLNLNYDPTPVPEPANAVTVLALFSGAVLQRRKRVVRH